MATQSALINVMFKACQKAGRGLRRDFGEVENLQVSKKGPVDFVSTADHKAEETLREELTYARPDYGLMMEESGATPSKDMKGRRWIVDPLDGTLNFLHGLPHFAISVAMEEEGDIVAGAVYQPLTDEFFWAEKGKGAYLNDRRLRVSARKNIGEALFATGIPVRGLSGDHDKFILQQRAIMEETAGVRRYGAAALDLAWLAAGRFEGFWEMKLNLWDIAAGVLLVKEAGGMISDLSGRDKYLESGDIVAANNQLHGQFLKLLRSRKA